METAIFGGGCFWCTEAVFQQLRGVLSVTSGYAGGHVANPTYEQVSSGSTGHAEVIKFEFDPEQISYHDLLEVFFGHCHVHKVLISFSSPKLNTLYVPPYLSE